MLSLSNLYIFRYDGDDMVHSMSVWIPFARKREQWLHDQLDKYRVSIKRRMPRIENGKGLYKVGISNSPKDRLKQVNANPRDGGTEYFLMPPRKAFYIKRKMFWWSLKWTVIQLILLCAISLIAFKYLQ